MTYKEAITQTMSWLAEDKKVVFMGYNVLYGKAGGTLAGVPESQLIEMPVAENLMVGAAIGMALEGYQPVVYFERMDFMLNAMDALINHADVVPQVSEAEFVPRIMIRAVIGKTTHPLYTGVTHTGHYGACLDQAGIYVDFLTMAHPKTRWRVAKPERLTVVIEEADLYDVEM